VTEDGKVRRRDSGGLALAAPGNAGEQYQWQLVAGHRCSKGYFKDGVQIKEPKMAFIDYEAEEIIPPDDRVPDQDNILRVHSVHSRTMRLHYDLYRHR